MFRGSSSLGEEAMMLEAAVILAILLASGLLVLLVRRVSRARRKQRRREQRRIRNIAHERAWTLIYGRRQRRLTYAGSGAKPDQGRPRRR